MKIKPNFYLPLIWEEITDTTNFFDWQFLRPLIGKRVFWASVNWVNCRNRDLPPGYRAYVIKTEGPNVEWVQRQSEIVDAPIFYCCLPKDYGTFDHLSNVHFVPVIEWHYQLKTMSEFYGGEVNKDIHYKVSALCHRGTQSKVVVLSALAQHIGLDQCLVTLHYTRDDEVHYWQPTKNPIIDDYTQYFLDNFYQKNIIIDEFDNQDPVQVHNFHKPAYLNSAINVNNESFHYSYMQTKDCQRINPGPFITEKTLKCLLSETAFIHNGQFDVYNTLRSLGFQFDYGLDLSYDLDSGNLSRLAKVIEVIGTLSDISTMDLYQRTRHSCLHNKEHIMSGSFYQQAQAVNNRVAEAILQKL